MPEMKIRSIRPIPRKTRYDLTIPTLKNFYANDILIHNTSIVLAHLPVSVELNYLSRLAKWLGVKVVEEEYGVVVSSRKVIKSIIRPSGTHQVSQGGWYSEDIWTQVGHEVSEQIPMGFTIYGEIVGYTPSGGPIQKGYHYGCPTGEHALRVYRVTFTNPNGKVFELHWKHMIQFCQKYGFTPVVEEFYGTAEEFVLNYHPNNKEAYFSFNGGSPANWELISSAVLPDKGWKNPIVPDGETPEEANPEKVKFSQLFLEAVEHKYLEGMCEYNRREVPSEGVVIRMDTLDEALALKSKSFKFFEYETKALDKGELDLESEESEG